MRRGMRHLVLAMAVILSAAACGGRTDPPSRSTAVEVDVRVARAAIQPIARTFEAGGAIRAQTTAQLSSRIVADVRELRVQPGDRVRRGQVVAVLDDRDLVAARAQAQASLSAAQSAAASADADAVSAAARRDLARANFQRFEQLREKNSATPQELDEATAELQMAEAAVGAAGARVAGSAASVAAAQAAARAAEVGASFATITAPFDGLVTSRFVEPGNMVSPGLPLLTVEAADGFRLEAQIDESRARSLQIGQPVVVELGSAGDPGPLTGHVAEIAQTIDPVGHAFVVKVQLPADANVRSGMFARARFEAEQREALVVPASAVVRRGQLALVFVVDDNGRARMRAVTTGEVRDAAVEVLAGVQPGELLVLNPPAALVDGAAVRVMGGRP